MKKILSAIAALSTLFFAACDTTPKGDSEKAQSGESATSSYLKHESDLFSMEYPSSWDTVIYIRPFQPFMASSPSEEQVLVMATRPIQGMSLDSFVIERIDAFKNNNADWTFELVEKKLDNNKATIHYTYTNQYTAEKFGTIMNIYSQGEYFYGVDCLYHDSLQRDTVQYMLNSIKFN